MCVCVPALALYIQHVFSPWENRKSQQGGVGLNSSVKSKFGQLLVGSYSAVCVCVFVGVCVCHLCVRGPRKCVALSGWLVKERERWNWSYSLLFNWITL